MSVVSGWTVPWTLEFLQIITFLIASGLNSMNIREECSTDRREHLSPARREAKSRVDGYAWQMFHNAGTILEETLAGMRHRDFQGCDTPADSLQYRD